MGTQQNTNQHVDINKVHQLLTKNIDDFKYLVLCNMRLDEKNKSENEPLHLDVNRISDFEMVPTESLEEWVGRESASKTDNKGKNQSLSEAKGESLEEWVSRQTPPVKKKKAKKRTIIDIIEQWLMNEAKKDLFAEIDAINAGPENLSSAHIRELGETLIALADKLDKQKAIANAETSMVNNKFAKIGK